MFAHERQVNSMAARTYKEWWAKNSYKYFWAECVAETIWNAAIKSLEGVQTQPTNSQRDVICPSCKSTDIAVSEYLCLTCDGLFIKEAAGKRTPI